MGGCKNTVDRLLIFLKQPHITTVLQINANHVIASIDIRL